MSTQLKGIFGRDRESIVMGIAQQSEAINKQCMEQNSKLIQQNICEYVRLCVKMHQEKGLGNAVVMIENGDLIPLKKIEAIKSQLQHLRLQMTTRLLVNLGNTGILDLLYTPQEQINN